MSKELIRSTQFSHAVMSPEFDEQVLELNEQQKQELPSFLQASLATLNKAMLSKAEL